MLALGGARSAPGFDWDGADLRGVLSGAAAFRRPLYWRMNYRNQRAYRDGDWKYLQVDTHEYLFNISADERERANLAARYPERLAGMREDWESWARTMPDIPADATFSPGFGLKNMPQR